jgi:hypothetical protein
MLTGVGDAEIVSIVRHHHERMDGSGYPDGLAGAAIPVGARIIAVADTFDAITSNRAYRRAGTQKKALDILREEAGPRLDGEAVAAFRHRYSDRRSIASLAVATAVAQRAVIALQAASHGLAASTAGIASILPALGVAGALSLSPGVSRQAHRVSSPAGAQAPPVVAGAVPPTQRLHATPRANARAGLPTHRRNRVNARTSPLTGSPRHATALPPSAPSGQRTGGGHDGGAGAQSPSGRPGLPLTPPVTPPPTDEQPPVVPPPPVTPPPVTLPSVPSVPGAPTLPSVPPVPGVPSVRSVTSPVE